MLSSPKRLALEPAINPLIRAQDGYVVEFRFNM